MTIFSKIFNRKKMLLVIATICLLIMAALKFGNSVKASEENLPFETSRIERGDLEITISSTGSLAAQGTVEIGTQVSGTIETITVDYNDKVKKGQVLAKLDQAIFRADVLQAKASVASAQAQFDQAQAEYNRNAPLKEKKYISDEEFMAFITNLNMTKANLSSAKAVLTRAQINLKYTVICSPIDGTVIEKSIEEGQTVAASLSTPTLFLIAEDLSQMQIEAAVDESDIGQIKIGQSTKFEVAAYPDRKFSGKVEQIRLQPQTVSNVVTYTVVVESTNEDGVLLPGMTATIEFMVAQQKDSLLVPDSAFMVSLGGRNHSKLANSKTEGRIFVVAKGEAPRAIRVEKGLSDGSNTVVIGDDIREGMQVITSVKAELQDEKRGLFSRLMPGPPGSRRGGGRK